MSSPDRAAKAMLGSHESLGGPVLLFHNMPPLPLRFLPAPPKTWTSMDPTRVKCKDPSEFMSVRIRNNNWSASFAEVEWRMRQYVWAHPIHDSFRRQTKPSKKWRESLHLTERLPVYRGVTGKMAVIIANSRPSVGRRDPAMQELALSQTQPAQGRVRGLFSNSPLEETIFTDTSQGPVLDSRATLWSATIR